MDNYTDNFYNDEWVDLSQPNTDSSAQLNEDESTDSEKDKANKKSKPVSSPVLTIQLILCLCVLTILFVLKTFAFEIFSICKTWYDTELNSSMYFSGDFSQLDYSSLFTSTADEL